MSDSFVYYSTLIKPEWAPPAELFGPVWSVLYFIIILSFGFVGWQLWRNRLPRRIAMPFAINIISNLVFTPLQFGLQNNLLATLDIMIVLGSLIWLIVHVYPHHRWVAIVNIPYVLWVSFATILQITITYLNW